MPHLLRFPTALVLFLALTHATHAQHYNATVPPRPEDKYKSADFSIWIPEGVKTIRAVIVHQHGCGRNGIAVPHDLHWQALAKKHDAALMGSHLVPRDKCTDWHDPANGSDHAFHAALKEFSRQSNHPELESAPWCLWGHSGGAHWAFAMTQRYPQRVVAVVPRSGAQWPADHTLKALDVPVLFQLGARENAPGNRFNQLYRTAADLFARGRSQNAQWSFAPDPKSEHDTRHSRLIAIPFFDACLTARLPSSKSANHETALRPLDPSNAWVGDLQSFEIAPATSFKGNAATVAWLPDESTAKLWREFVTTGTVKDLTPPPPPHAPTATLKEAQVVLTWSADIDLESGIKAFHVYRDNQRIATLAGPPGSRPPQSFQSGNYGDEPEPVRPEMTYSETAPAGKHRYEVSAVNHSDLESPRSISVDFHRE